jgi:hypothetical protein
MSASVGKMHWSWLELGPSAFEASLSASSLRPSRPLRPLRPLREEGLVWACTPTP